MLLVLTKFEIKASLLCHTRSSRFIPKIKIVALKTRLHAHANQICILIQERKIYYLKYNKYSLGYYY